MRAFPDLFGPEPRAPDGSAMAFGFAVGEGWRPIVLRLLDELREAAKVDGVPARVTQVKEKWGRLMIRVGAHAPAIDAAIERATEAAARTCEECGRPGQLRPDHPHVQVLCGACAERGHLVSPRSLAELSDRPDIPRSREVAAVIDIWAIGWEGVRIVLTGVERGAGTRVREPVVAVDYRPVPRAYPVRGWLEFGDTQPAMDVQGHLLEWGHEADMLRDRLLGRGR